MALQQLKMLRRWFSQNPTEKNVDERNVSILYIELVFASFLSVAASFNGAFILRLGGSNALVGLLSSVPALIAAIVYLPSARILERKTRMMPYLLGSLSLARVGYVALAILPFVLNRFLPEVTAAILVAMTAFSAFFATAWSPMFGDIIPVRSRSTVISWRAILSSLTIAPLVFLAGRWLVSIRFPLNYQLLYVFGWRCGQHLSRVATTSTTTKTPRSQAAGTPGRHNKRYPAHGATKPDVWTHHTQYISAQFRRLDDRSSLYHPVC
jgi:hypothetical protein